MASSNATEKVGSYVWHGDGREEAVLNHVLQHPNIEKMRANPAAVLSEIDKWVEDNKILMTIGPVKGNLVTEVIVRSKPEVMVELGCYIGYSAIKFGAAVRAAGGKQYFSLESNARYAAIASTLVELAGLKDFVKIVVGSSSESLQNLDITEFAPKIGVLFIDHAESLYLTDLKIAESRSLLDKKSHVIADNVRGPDSRSYLDWVNGESPPSRYKSELMDFVLATGDPDGIIFSQQL
ncbi:hypothetical protein BU24DRAFT_469667 [Aaosphaeria arxii CBS 175.79]|uniref:catechol O-methyltransferase n=1 Tax=Aaosphaeria arxii CBS 175.79 TaxID=1450172 RepID=A0A6A5Y6G7_9PLEO|nr:uncharacterized protein BU24DRAFT_469667 [Aaosphaeria arxii CBS 175.79]KAF2020889.1 hypothetical protein BU24DRAFT_469667 [Aaosphaeria arxii CBS 175.79]